MNFKEIGDYNSGHSQSGTAIYDIVGRDTTPMTYILSCIGEIHTKDQFKNTPDFRLFLNWFYTVLYNGNEVYEFNATEKFEILDINESLQDEKIREVIKAGYKHLKKEFENRMKEFKALQPMADILPEKIEQILQQLKAILLKLQQ